MPFITEHVDGFRRMRPQLPIENYYPAIVDRGDWDRIQTKRGAWAAHHHVDGPKTGRANLLAGLSRCPFCDRPMVLLCCGNSNWRYLMCRRAYNGAGSDQWIRYAGIEIALYD